MKEEQIETAFSLEKGLWLDVAGVPLPLLEDRDDKWGNFKELKKFTDRNDLKPIWFGV